MFKSKVKSIFRKSKNSRIYQGDILKDLEFVTGDPDKYTSKDLINLSFAVVLSQDCDLESDYRDRHSSGNDQDKNLLSILVCPAFKIEDFAQGCHLNGLQMKKFFQGDIKKLYNNNEFKRYHYLKGDSKFLVPELVLDFKHFFTLPRDFLYQQRKSKYIASLNEIFREELSQRFSNYLSRIGLPEL